MSGHGGTRRPDTYEGPAHIAIGTTIFAQPGNSPWATVERDGVFAIRHKDGDAWVKVTKIPGITSDELAAYVPMTAIEKRP